MKACLIVLPVLLLARLSAAPWRPASDDAVLEILPAFSRHSADWKAARSRIQKNPADREAALDLARNYLENAQRSSDAIFVSFAEGALRPFRSEDKPDVLYLRAIIHQHKHAFNEALADLDRALALQPSLTSALIAKASILITLGRYSDAREIFRANFKLTREITGLTLFCNLSSLFGSIESSFKLLRAQGGAATNSFALGSLAEMAVRMGDTASATGFFLKALAIDPDDSWTKAAFCDLLLTNGRAREVLDRIEPNTPSDALLLRRVLALGQTAAKNGKSEALSAASRFRQSGHFRELAILQLRFFHEPQKALQCGLCNWELQKEPIDALVVLESAAASGHPQAAHEVLAWLSEHKLEDARMSSVRQRLSRSEFTRDGALAQK